MIALINTFSEISCPRMKKLLLIYILLIFVCHAFSQEKNQTPSLLTTYEIKPGWNDSLSKALPFRAIEVWDRRFDTSKLGYIKRFAGFKKIITEGKTETILQAYLNNRYKNNLQQSSCYDLLLVVKHLWLQETTDAQETNQKIVISSSSNDIYFSEAISVLEVYAKQDDKYIPLLKLDSTFQWNGVLLQHINDFFVLPFEICFKKLANMDFQKRVEKLRRLSLQEIANHQNKPIQYARFQTDIIEKGIYLTFDDFLNNKLYKKDFTVEFGSLTDELYITENGKQTILEKFWGFCDGKKNYIKLGYNFSQLFKESNTYELWGSKSINQKFVQYKPTGGGSPARTGLEGALGSALFNRKKTSVKNKPLQLNMEKGDVY